MATDGTTVIDLAGYLLTLYVAVCLGFVGFGMMLGGKAWAQQVARFFFVRPLAGLAAAVRYRAWQLAAVLWQAGAAIVVFAFAGIWRTVLRPIGRLLWRGPRWLIQSRRRLAVIVAVIVLCGLTVVAFAAGAPPLATREISQARAINVARPF